MTMRVVQCATGPVGLAQIREVIDRPDLDLGVLVYSGQGHEPLLPRPHDRTSVSYTHPRAHETGRKLVCRLLLEKKKTIYSDHLHSHPPLLHTFYPLTLSLPIRVDTHPTYIQTVAP